MKMLLFASRAALSLAAPYYTNATCGEIQEHQNCMKYGRPDLGFLRWRWRPERCELPRFDAAAFMEVVRGRSMAFVGDSLARNHMQSLMCLLSKVENPKDVSTTKDPEFRTVRYESHNFTVAAFRSPYLVTANQSSDPAGGMWDLYLDEPDAAWATAMEDINVATKWTQARVVVAIDVEQDGVVAGCVLLQRVNPMAAASLTALAVVVLLTASASRPSFLRRFEPSIASLPRAARRAAPADCDIFRGEWVPATAADDGAAPYYTNATCGEIQEHQNCIKYGRPDLGFLRWRWRPERCELPRFDAAAFLDLLRGKSMAFVGDSLSRNHMQSLLWRIREKFPKTADPEFRAVRYESHNFTVAVFRSPYLVTANQSDPAGGMWDLYLDEPDAAWATVRGGLRLRRRLHGDLVQPPDHRMYARALTCSPRPDPSTTSPPLSPAVDFHICVSGARSIGDLPLLTRRHGDATGEASSVTVMKRLSIRGLLAGARRTRHAVAAKATTSVPALVALLFFFAAATFSVEAPARSRDAAAGLERWRFPAHGFAVAYFWTPFQVRWRLMRGPPEAVGPERQGEVFAGPSDLHLDEPRRAVDVRRQEPRLRGPLRVALHGRVVGCHDCGGDDNATAAAIVKKPEHAQRAAFRAVLGALARLDGFNGTAILRTVAPTHYENGGWFDGGECTATRPVNESEDGAAAPEMAATEAEFYRAQVEEFAAAAAARRGNGGGARAQLRLMDVTRMMLLRPDGHPDRHGHGGGEHDGFEIDCLHWCLPGAIDVWNDLLLHIIASS
uniref:Trichome birefringence-like N-terminal domain-containing protein n=1 Tax=Oryza barthii TaxID=65489 RepID=A0A0D3GF85_9ORYZ